MKVTTYVNGEKREPTKEEVESIMKRLMRKAEKLLYNNDVYFEGEEGYKNPKSG